MSLYLQQAVVARLKGVEVLTGRAAAAQRGLTDLLARLPDGTPAARYGAKGSSALYPEVTLRQDGGSESLNAPDVGAVENTIFRFELWENTRGGLLIATLQDYLEQLLDSRRGAPDWTVGGEGRVWDSTLFSRLQGPFHDDVKDAYYGLSAFAWVEARP